MWLASLRLQDWRNYAEANISLHPGVNFFSGGNGQGKTNLLEAVDTLSVGKPFRTARDAEVIRFGADCAVLSGLIHGEGRDTRIDISFPSAGKKRVLVDRAASTAAALAGKLPCVLFCPEDLNLIQSGPAIRRKLMNATLCQLRPRYAAELAVYSRLIEQKTAILKKAKERPDLLELLPEYNERIAVTGAELIRFRAAFVRLLFRYAPPLHAEISGGEELSGVYKTVSTVENPFSETGELADALRAHLASHREAELASASCLSGPHRDDICISIDGREARTYASQGQCRTAAIALKLACRTLMENEKCGTPILLLDDILSELDAKRQDYVLNRIDRGQIFITGCETDAAERLRAGRIFTIKSGKITDTRDF